MTDISTLGSFIVVAFCGCWAGLGQAGLGCIYDGLKLSLVGRKQASKQARTGCGSDGRTRTYGQFWSLGVYLWCLLLNVLSRHVPPIPHLPPALKALTLYLYLLIQSHIFHRLPRFPSKKYYSGSPYTILNTNTSPPHTDINTEPMEIKRVRMIIEH